MVKRPQTVLALLALLPLVTGATPPVEEYTRKLGSEIAEVALQRLQNRLLSVLSKDGVEKAINVCKLEAEELTQPTGEMLAQGVTIKRTSDRIRNPRNVPDELEKAALALFGKNPDATEFVQTSEVERPRYYKPLYVKPLCLNCHGVLNEMSREVQEAIQSHYPNDNAYGYKVGELRGIIRVELPAH